MLSFNYDLMRIILLNMLILICASCAFIGKANILLTNLFLFPIFP